MTRLLSTLPVLALLLATFAGPAAASKVSTDPIAIPTDEPIRAGLFARTTGWAPPSLFAGDSGSCSECKGGVVELTLQYNGSQPASIKVDAKKKVYDVGTVQPGGFFTIKGTGKDGKFEENNLKMIVNGQQVAEIHVSCSQPINPGLTFGPFLVLEAVSRSGGQVCPIDGPDIDIEVEKSIDFSGSDFSNRRVAYNILVRNSGDAEAAASMIKVQDHLPPFADVLNVDSPSGTTFDSGTQTWTIARLDVGQEIELGIRLKLNSTKSGSRNCVSVTAAMGDDIDSTPDNFDGSPSEDDESCVEASLIDLELTKTVSDQNPAFGDEIVYTITLTNSGDAQVTAHDITVSELFPAGFEIVALAPSKGTVNASNLNWNVSSLGIGESATLKVTVKAAPTPSGSDLVPNGLYRLHNHPDGSAGDPEYGLRLDELFGDWSPITFSFDRGDSEVWMQVSGSTITIYGRVFGGEDGGSDYTPGWSGYWDLFFEFDGTVAPVAGDDDLFATLGSNGSRGYIIPQFSTGDFQAGDRFDLAGYMDAGASFFLGNESNDQGHRGFNGLSGWGWLEHGQGGSLNHVASSDWLFTAELAHPNGYKNCVQVWEAEEQDLDSGYGNGFTLGEDDDACAKVHVDPKQLELIDLAVQKVVSSYDSRTGEAIYVVTVLNEGDREATGVKVRDYLPADAFLVSGTATTTQGTFDGRVWEVGSLQINGLAELRFKARIGTSGETRNCAEVVAADQRDFDSDPDNFDRTTPAEDDEACARQPLIDLRLEKKALDPTTVNVGQNATFVLTVTNDGPDDAVGVLVRDHLPTGLSVASTSPSQGTFDTAARTWFVGNLNVGQSATLNLVARATKEGTLANCAEIKQAAPQDRDSVPGNYLDTPREDDEACASIWVVDPRIDLTLKKSASPTNALVGGIVTFTLDVENTSDVEATGVVIADFLPTGLELVTTRPAANAGATSWSFASIPAGSGRTIEIDVRVKSAGEHTNCAEVRKANQTDADSTPGNFATSPKEDDEACASIWTTDPKTDLKLVKTVNKTQVVVGDQVAYTLTVTNQSGVSANGVVVADYLPAGVTITGATPSQGDLNGTSWNVGFLAGNAAATLTLKAAVGKAGELKNCAEIWDASPTDVDSTPGNFNSGVREDDDSCVTIWSGTPKVDLRLEKSVNKSNASVGGSVTYTVTVRNDGSVAATGIVVADYLPGGLTVTATRPDQGTLSGLTWTVGTLAASSSTSLQIDAKVNAAGEFTNCAEIWDANEQDPDSTPGNFNRAKAPAEDDEACVSIWTNDPRVDLRLSKTVSKSNVNVGDVVTYALVVSNDGPADASGIVVADYLPNGATIKASRANKGAFSNRSWNLGFLALGQTARLELDVQIEIAGELTNCAEIWDASPADKDSTPGNFSVSAREDDEACVSIWSREVTGTNEITGFVFVDVNQNLIFDAGDYGQGGALVQLWRDLNGNTEVDGSDQFVDDVVTAADGSYGFWINETGAFALQVDASTIPPGANLLGGNSEDANFVGFGQTDSGNNFPLVFMGPPPPDAMCYLVADNDGNGADSPDVLTKLATDASYEQVIGSTGTDHIESIAFNPWTGVLYAADDRRLGTLDVATGQFTEIGEFGGGEGETGWRPFLDIDGLAFDPLSGDLFASVRKVGEPDFLIKVNPATGSSIPFSGGVDYLVIKSPFGLNDIDDIAIDPEDGSIWAINNEDGDHSRLVKIDRNTGVVLDVKALPIANVEGLGFFGDGTLYGTGGEGLESIVVIDKSTLSVQVLLTIGSGGNRDYEAVDCLTNATNSLSVSVFNDRNGDGWMTAGDAGLAGVQVELFRDVNRNGIADFADKLVAVSSTGGNGTARFEAAANGAFVTRIAEAGLPLGARVTSKGTRPSWFNGFGEASETGMVGVSLPAASATSTASEDEPQTEVPVEFALKAAYPNPFNPQTTVPFDLTQTVDVRLAVYDVLGRQVALLVDGTMAAGSHQAHFDAGALPSGTYLIRLSAGAQSGIRTVTLIK